MRKRCLVMCFMALVPAAAGAQISPGELSRAHADLEGIRNCTKCHELGEGPNDEKCLDCHREIAWSMGRENGFHKAVAGAGGKECYECHSEHAGRDFQLVHWPGGVNSFDHEKTGYRLTGKHAGLKCRDCHQPALIREDLSRFGDHVVASRTYLGLASACRDCHRDEHRGQLATVCTNCHTQDGWKPVTAFDHARTAYPLTGRHTRVDCGKCHPTVASNDPRYPGSDAFVRFTGISHSNCTPCHTDVHRGNYGARCATCHNTSAWRDIPVAMFDHTKTSFPLLGRHAGLPCEKCHAPGARKSPLPHQRCTDCHIDVHQGQFASRPDGGDCESCHTVNGFVPALFTAADHDATRFALQGAHLAQPCFACHPNVTAADGSSYRQFTVDDTGCASCHEDPHAGQFASARPPKGCTGCHGVEAWTQLAFDHNRDSSYKLEGEHRRVPCRGCHLPATVEGRTFVRYKPINPSCKTCHAGDELDLGSVGNNGGST